MVSVLVRPGETLLKRPVDAFLYLSSIPLAAGTGKLDRIPDKFGSASDFGRPGRNNPAHEY